MKVELLESFVTKLNDQVRYISRDKPQAARKFKNDLLKKIETLENFPFNVEGQFTLRIQLSET